MPRMNGAVEWDAHMSILWHCFRDVNGQSVRNRENERATTFGSCPTRIFDHVSQTLDALQTI